MSYIAISSLLLALAVYISIGIIVGLKTRGIADLFPLAHSRRARVKNEAEFSSSTVATTISLATVVILLFQLGQFYGLWLFWTVITTAGGLLVVRLFAGRIWERMYKYDHRPTLHEFLGVEFNSDVLSYVGAVCTSLGFLGAFAVELMVGSKFLAGLVPGIPAWVVVVVLSLVSFSYTAVGGFRAVIVTDRIQMVSIWLLLIAMPLFYIYHIATHGGWALNFEKIPPEVLNLSYRPGLLAFLFGIFVLNVPTFISDMSIWQRIAGAQRHRTVTGGLWRGVFVAASTWGLFVILACFVFMILEPSEQINPLVSLLDVIASTKGFIASSVLFVTILGLYGAMLSTASTQLIAVSHTLYADIFSRFGKKTLKEKLDSKKELNISRLMLILAAIVSTILVQALSNAGFSITDLVFAIYGAQVGLCPLVISALLMEREQLRKLSIWAALAITAGFVTGWGTAIHGRFTGNTDLVFLSPVFSLIASSMLLFSGIAYHWQKSYWRKNVNLILIRSVIKARRSKLYRFLPAEVPMRLDCLKEKCARCCKALGTPVATEEEAKRIGYESIIKDKDAMFIRSQSCVCTLLRDGLCSIYPERPKGCREYPWYNIGGALYYDSGCPGIKRDKDERPDVNSIQPFDNFFPRTPRVIVRLIKKICIRRDKGVSAGKTH